MPTSSRSDVVIVGAGIVGLCLAYQLCQRGITTDITIIEKESSIGFHTSGRNSGVLHAGIYYDPGSLKASVCTQGAKRLRSWVEKRNLPIFYSGKIIVPQEPDLEPQLDVLLSRGTANGAECTLVDSSFIHSKFPYVNHAVSRGLWSPNTCIVNPKSILDSLYSELVQLGVRFLFETRIIDSDPQSNSFVLSDNSRHSYKHLFNCSGLYSDSVASLFKVPTDMYLIPFKGLYWEFSNTLNITTNVYPVPDLNTPFLGVHFTPSINSSTIYIGPTATPALGPENYTGIDGFNLLSSIQSYTSIASMYVNNKNNFRNYVHNQLPLSFQYYLSEAARKLIPSISDISLKLSSKVGIRPQLFDPNTQKLIDDFVLINHYSTSHVLNAISPAFTSSFSLSDYIIDQSSISL